MEMHDVIRQRRSELGLSQADLAAKVGVDRRQIRRYEAGEMQPTLPIAKKIAHALEITIDELAGGESHRIDLSGQWWAVWQTWWRGQERATPHELRINQRSDTLDLVATSRGTSFEEGGYLWRGEARIFDNEALIGWYVGDEGAVRSKGSLYFNIHQHGQRATGRWVGLSHDGPLISGWAAVARTENEVLDLLNELRGGNA